jgi:hypothetical protein
MRHPRIVLLIGLTLLFLAQPVLACQPNLGIRDVVVGPCVGDTRTLEFDVENANGQNGNGWQATDVTVEITWSQDGVITDVSPSSWHVDVIGADAVHFQAVITIDSCVPANHGQLHIHAHGKDADGNGNYGADKPSVRVDKCVCDPCQHDTTPPELTLIGNATVYLECGVDTYTELGADFSDNCCIDPPVIIGGDTVDTSTPGTYTITYNISDCAGNPAIQLTRTVIVQDTTPPAITHCPDDITVNNDPGECGANVDWTEPTAEDDCCLASFTSTHSPGDFFPLGTTTVTYTATDCGDLTATCTFDVTVKDNEKPVITLNGGDMTVECGDPFTDPGSAMEDNCCEGPANVTGTVDTSTPGDYYLYYNGEDCNGNAADQVVRKVTVVDTTPPVITLNGNPAMEIQCGDPYDEPGATVYDDCCAGPPVIGGDAVDTSTPGTYVVTYDSTDCSGNPAEQKTRTVNVVDTTPPVLTIIGDATVYLECGIDAYVEPGAGFSDNCCITGPVIIGGDTVDTSVTGTYVVTYDITDCAGNAAAQITRTVIVQDTIKPAITLNGDQVMEVQCGDPFEDPGATMKDNCCPGEVIVTGTVNTDIPGDYYLYYNGKDCNGNAADQVVRKVTVVDTTPPVITGCPGDITVDKDPEVCGANVDWTEPTAEDDCCLASFTSTHSPGDFFPLGTTTVTYTATDCSNLKSECSFTVTVINHPPVADADGPYSGPAGSNIPLDGTDSYDPDGDTIFYFWDFDNDDQFDDAIGPSPNFSTVVPGLYTVGLKVTDSCGGVGTDRAEVEVTNSVVADANGPYTMHAGDTINLDGSGSYDPEGHAIVSYEWDLDDGGFYDDATGINPPYTNSVPGTYTVGIKVTDEYGATDTDTAQVEVTNDPPDAVDDHGATPQDTPVVIDVLPNDSDADNDSFTITVVTPPSHGTTTITGDKITYVPDPGYCGQDSFTYTITDEYGGADTATVYVDITCANDPPAAVDDSYTIGGDGRVLTFFDTANVQQGGSVLINVLGNDFLPVGWRLKIIDVGTPWHGDVEVIRDVGFFGEDEILYTPDPGFCGRDNFYYVVVPEDGIELEVDAPGVMANDNDPDGDPITAVLVSGPSYATQFSLNPDGSFIYVPEIGFFGTDRFRYKVHDGDLYSNVATVTITVKRPEPEQVYVTVECLTECAGKVIISEVAWAGTPASPEDEWIELRNLGEIPVNLEGWTLRWRKKHPETKKEEEWTSITLDGIIPGAPPYLNPCMWEEDWDPWNSIVIVRNGPTSVAGDRTLYYVWLRQDPIRYCIGRAFPSDNPEKPFFLAECHREETVLERYDDEVLDVPMNPSSGMVYHRPDEDGELPLFPLFDEGAVIQLLDSQGNVVDTANVYESDDPMWPAGDISGRTMERVDPLGPDEPWNWDTNQGVMAFRKDAAFTPLFATPWDLNEPPIDWTKLPSWWTGQVSDVEQGEILVLHLPIATEVLESQLVVRVATTAEVLEDTSSVRLSDGKIVIDTAALASAEYRIWIIPQPGLTFLVPFRLQER